MEAALFSITSLVTVTTDDPVMAVYAVCGKQSASIYCQNSARKVHSGAACARWCRCKIPSSDMQSIMEACGEIIIEGAITIDIVPLQRSGDL